MGRNYKLGSLNINVSDDIRVVATQSGEVVLDSFEKINLEKTINKWKQKKDNFKEILHKIEETKVHLNHLNSEILTNYSAQNKKVNLLTSGSERNSFLIDKALEDNNSKVVSFLLKSNFNINFKNSAGDSLIHSAIRYQNKPLFDELLARKAVMSINNSGQDPLALASSIPTANYFVEALNSVLNPLNQLNAEEGIFNQIIDLFKSYRAIYSLQNQDIPTDYAGYDKLVKAKEASFNLMIQSISNVNIRDADGKSLLIYAAENAFYNPVKQLIGRGADPAFTDKLAKNALLYAASFPHIGIIKLLATKTKAIDQRDINGDTVLHVLMKKIAGCSIFQYEIENELSEIVSLSSEMNISNLTRNYLDISKYVGRCEDAFSIELVFEKFKLITTELLNYGARLELQNNQGLTIFTIACMANNHIIMKYLLDNFCSLLALDRSDESGVNSLVHTISSGNLEITKQIIELLQPESISQQDQEGRTPLMWAMYYNQYEIAQYIISKHDNPRELFNIPDKSGQYIIHYASKLGLQKFVDLSCIYTDVNLKSENDQLKYTPLCAAAHAGHIDILKYLLNKGAVVDQEEVTKGYTPLYYAVVQDNLNLVKFLIEQAGADINKADYEKISPLYWAFLGHNSYKSHLVEYLVDKGADVNQAMYDGDTPMTMVAYRGLVEAGKLLLAKGAHIDQPNLEGKTPLITACIKFENTNGLNVKQQLETVKFLLQNGANMLHVDNQNHTAKDYIAENMPVALPLFDDCNLDISGMIALDGAMDAS